MIARADRLGVRARPGKKALLRAYLGELTLRVQHDPTGQLVFVRLPGTPDEISVNDGYDGVGPIALRHYADRRPAEELPVDYDDVDGVEVYRVETPLGSLIFPARFVPLLPRR